MKKEKSPTIALIKTPLWQSIAAYLIIVVGQLLAHLPVLTTSYLRPDDYHHLYASILHSDVYITLAIAQARLFNILHYYFFLLIGNIDGMWIARAVSLLGTILLAFCIFNLFRRYGENTFLSALFTLFITLTPAFREFTGFTVMYLAPWGIILAYLAFRCLERALELPQRQKIFWSALAVFLLVLAYNIFPPSATFIAVFICIFLLYSKSAQKLQNTFFFLLISGVGTITHFLIFKTYLVLLNMSPLARTGLIENPTEKISWLISSPLYFALNLTNIPSNKAIALTVLLVIILGLFLHLRDKKTDMSVSLILILLLLLFSYSSNLAFEESVTTYRTLAALTGILAVLFILGLKEVFALIRKQSTKLRLSYIVFGIMVLFSVIQSSFYLQQNATRYGVILAEFRSALGNFDAEEFNRIVLTYNNEKEYKQALIHYYYPDAIDLILYENGKGIEPIPITIRANSFSALPDDYIIPIDHLTPTQQKAAAISAKYIEE